MTTEDVDFRELLDDFADSYFQQFHAPIYGVVQTYDSTKQTADVLPLVLLYVEGDIPTEAPILRSVPIAFPGGAVTSYTWPLVAGDRVELVPQDADIGTFVASGSVGQLPQSKRRFSLSDCVAFPMNLRSQVDPLPPTAMAADGGVLSGLHYAGGSDASDFASMALKVKSEIDTLIASFNAHVHSGPGTPPTPISPPAPGAPIPVLPSGSTACTQLKVK